MLLPVAAEPAIGPSADEGDEAQAARLTPSSGASEASSASDVADLDFDLHEYEEEAAEEELTADFGEELLLLPPSFVVYAAPEEEPRKGSKCSQDPVARARRRVRLRLRQEVRAARKARRLERAKAKKRKGAGIDVEEFLLKTRERVEKHEAEIAAEALASAMAEVAPAGQRGRGVDICDFSAKTRCRLRSRMHAAQLSAAEAQASRAAKASATSSADLEAFQRETRARVVQRLWSSVPDLPSVASCQFAGVEAVASFRRRRVAIVGAGPVGLWAAFLFTRRYGCIDGHSRMRRPDAPDLTVFECRPQTAHCLRTDVRIALSSNTQKLLNRRTKSASFASGMAVAEIEAELLCHWRERSHKAAPEFGCVVEDPVKLVRDGGFDCVIWAAGRRSLSSSLRSQLNCEQRIGDAEQVLVYQLGNLQGPDPWQHGGDLTGPVQQAARIPTLRTMLRPGLGGQCSCWLWIFGLPEELRSSATKGDTSTADAKAAPHATMSDALVALLNSDSPYVEALRRAADFLQSRLKPTSSTLRWVEASFWSSDRSVVDLGTCDAALSGVPLVLVGDAASGKPFYTGTTLNKHLWDVDELVSEPPWNHGPLMGSLAAYERRYQADIKRLPAFRRQCPHQ